MPRVMCFLHSFEPGGVERTALRLCGAWHEAGAKVAIVVGRDEGALRAEAPGCEIIVPPGGWLPVGAIETAWMIAKLPGMIRRWRPDVLFCSGNTYTVVAVVMKLLLGSRCPPIVAKVSNDLLRFDLALAIRPFNRLWCRMQGRWLDHLVALSPEMRREVMSAMSVEPARISVIMNPVLDRWRREELAMAGRIAARTRSQGRRFLAAGRLVAQKDFATMIRAFALGAAPSDRLVIVGDGPERPRLERLMRDLAVTDRVTLVGHSPRLEDWIARSDVMLLSSLYEGLPGVVVEALAAGLGIVATNCCASIAGVLGHGRFGTLVEPGSVSAFADAIASAPAGQSDPEATMGLAGAYDAHEAAMAYMDVIGRLAPVGEAASRSIAPDRQAAWQNGV